MRRYGLGYVLWATMVVQAVAAGLDTNVIEQITGLRGNWNEKERVFKVSAPREDVKVSVDQRPMEPFLGLTSWAAFKAGKSGQAMVMGDLVLFQDEVNPVLTVGLANGVDITALHNHFFYDEPKVYFMHIGGEGPSEKLAEAVRRMLDRVKEIRAENPKPAQGFGGPKLPTTNGISAEGIEKVLGLKGQRKDGMFKVVVGREVKMKCGCRAGAEMGVNTWAAFAGTDENAVVDGDFAVTEDELQMLLRALRHWDINIVAIHNHMCGEKPRMIFVHYWGKARATRLAQAVRTALDTMED